MPDLTFLHEYLEGQKTAHVFKHHQADSYTVVCHELGETFEFGPFDTEPQAEDFAEDWVKGFIKDETKSETKDA